MADLDDIKDKAEEGVDAADDKLHEWKGQAEEKAEDASDEVDKASENPL